jgi:hypothetical protein
MMSLAPFTVAPLPRKTAAALPSGCCSDPRNTTR